VSGHWNRPISFNSVFTAQELQPESCGACHVDKLREWSGSLHSKSMGPGLLFQFDPLSDPDTASACYFCHAPLRLQSEIIRKKNIAKGGAYVLNKDFDKQLQATGVSCGVCHARDALITGPTSPKLRGLAKGVSANHGVRQNKFFTEASFCAACHQLREGFRLSGNLLVNTYNEWKESPFGQADVPCQSCHMPDRRHLFRGIHDREMARKGVKIEVRGVKDKGKTHARLTITNTGTGHYFPTYATPLIIVKGFLADTKGQMLKGTVQEAYIGRKISLDLSKEFFDTRIAPLDFFSLDLPLKKNIGARKAVFEATVYPDEFYNRFYEYYLTQGSSGKKKRQLEAAHKRSSNSAYKLFRKELPLENFFLIPERPVK